MMLPVLLIAEMCMLRSAKLQARRIKQTHHRASKSKPNVCRHVTNVDMLANPWQPSTLISQ